MKLTNKWIEFLQEHIQTSEQLEKALEYKSLGYFDELCPGMDFPSMKECVHDEPPDNKEIVLKYLKSGKKAGLAGGLVQDAFSKKHVGIQTHYSDGEWHWTESVIYHYDKYNIELPQEFIERVINQTR